MYKWHRLSGFVVLAILVGFVVTADAQTTGDTAGSKTISVPRPFRMFLVYDKRYEAKDERNREGKLHCPVCEHGLFSVMAVFSRSIPKKDDPLLAVIAKQEELATKYRARRLGAFVGFLSLTRDYPDDEAREPLTQQVADLGRETKVTQVALGFAEATTVLEGADPDSKELQPAPQVVAWGIKPEDEITIIVYHRFNIVKRWSFTKDKPPTAEDLKALGETVDEIMNRKQ